jgi:hypothetical protein
MARWTYTGARPPSRSEAYRLDAIRVTLKEGAMANTQPTQPAQQSPSETAQPTAPRSTASELWVSWLLIVLFILFTIVGLIWVIVDAPRLGYRRRDWLFVLIPIYGQYVFLPKMAWRIGHNDRPYWQNWPERVAP